MFRKIADNHVASSSGFEVKWSSRDTITYIEPPRHVEFFLEGYWDNTGVWQHEIVVPAEPKWRPPYHNEPLPRNRLVLIVANLIQGLEFLYPGVPFELRDNRIG
jgi:hypothetical protein